jgi:hypothetical protein
MVQKLDDLQLVIGNVQEKIFLIQANYAADCRWCKSWMTWLLIGNVQAGKYLSRSG